MKLRWERSPSGLVEKGFDESDAQVATVARLTGAGWGWSTWAGSRLLTNGQKGRLAAAKKAAQDALDARAPEESL